MEIEINSKRNNPLLNRTEVHLIIKHQGEKTPDRELIRSELAGKLNTKKENIIINDIRSSSGIQECTVYAKIYPSTKKAEEIERDYIIKRNQTVVKKEKKDDVKKPDEKPEENSKKLPVEEEKQTGEIQKEEKIDKPEEKNEKQLE